MQEAQINITAFCKYFLVLNYYPSIQGKRNNYKKKYQDAAVSLALVQFKTELNCLWPIPTVPYFSQLIVKLIHNCFSSWNQLRRRIGSSWT